MTTLRFKPMMLGSSRLRAVLPLFAAILLVTSSGAVVAAGSEEEPRSNSEIVYVPAYARIHTHEKIKQPLASTLVVHNVDPIVTITLTVVRYHDQDGKILREFLAKPMTLQPFQSGSFLTQISETSGGIGANYLVEWQSQNPALSPVIEAVMVGGSGTQGISFTSRGRIIARGHKGTNE